MAARNRSFTACRSIGFPELAVGTSPLETASNDGPPHEDTAFGSAMAIADPSPIGLEAMT
jgi:hypothetical protein